MNTLSRWVQKFRRSLGRPFAVDMQRNSARPIVGSFLQVDNVPHEPSVGQKWPQLRRSHGNEPVRAKVNLSIGYGVASLLIGDDSEEFIEVYGGYSKRELWSGGI